MIPPGCQNEAFLKRVRTLIARAALFECESFHISDVQRLSDRSPMSDLGQLSRSEGAPMTSGPPQLTDILRVRRQSQRCQERTFFPQRSLARAFLRETHPRTCRLGSSGNPKDSIELR